MYERTKKDNLAIAQHEQSQRDRQVRFAGIRIEGVPKVEDRAGRGLIIFIKNEGRGKNSYHDLF